MVKSLSRLGREDETDWLRILGNSGKIGLRYAACLIGAATARSEFGAERYVVYEVQKTELT
jgi:hypothetical protein